MGGGGVDRLEGGAGDDHYYLNDISAVMLGGMPVADVYDTVVEAAGNGIDTVFVGRQASLTVFGTFVTNYTLGANVENGTVSGTGAFDLYGNVRNNILTGNEAANTLTGDAGNDRLQGAAGADTLIGGAGNDKYYLSDAYKGAFNIYYLDTVVEEANGGYDEVIVSRTLAGPLVIVNYTLGDNIEYGTVGGSGDFDLFGNALANVLEGNGESNQLDGADGDDWLIGSGGADVLNGGEGSDNLNGGSGADTLTGGNGNDTYLLGDVNADAFGNYGYDTVVEVLNGGNDTVEVTRAFTPLGDITNYTLGDAIDNGAVGGTGAFDLIGNALANHLDGNGDGNGLSGGAGLASDVLKGYGGNDYLDGQGGADLMYGGDGDDSYVVDDAGDRTIELAANTGLDQVYSYLSLTLATGIENLVLYGSTDLAGKGNALNNVINGSLGSNRLDGKAGDDTVYGYTGADVIIGGDGEDLLDGGADGDFIRGDAGNDTIIGDGKAPVGGNDRLFGGDGNDRLSGEDGNDQLTGGGGADQLSGGQGLDIFLFTSVTDSGDTAAVADSINGFESGADKIDVSAIDAMASAAGNNGFTFIGTADFSSEGQIRAIVTDNLTILMFNTAGTTSAEMVIVLASGEPVPSAIAPGDFVL